MGLQVLAMGLHPLQILAKGLYSLQVHTPEVSLWPCHVKHWGRPCVQMAPFSRDHPCCALAEPPGFTVVSGEVLGLIGADPLIFTRSDLKDLFLTHSKSQ